MPHVKHQIQIRKYKEISIYTDFVLLFFVNSYFLYVSLHLYPFVDIAEFSFWL